MIIEANFNRIPLSVDDGLESRAAELAAMERAQAALAEGMSHLTGRVIQARQALHAARERNRMGLMQLTPEETGIYFAESAKTYKVVQALFAIHGVAQEESEATGYTSYRSGIIRLHPHEHDPLAPRSAQLHMLVEKNKSCGEDEIPVTTYWVRDFGVDLFDMEDASDGTPARSVQCKWFAQDMDQYTEYLRGRRAQPLVTLEYARRVTALQTALGTIVERHIIPESEPFSLANMLRPVDNPYV